jgi:hypothetical protein
MRFAVSIAAASLRSVVSGAVSDGFVGFRMPIGYSRSSRDGTAAAIQAGVLALNAGWDLEMLSLEIGELGEASAVGSVHRRLRLLVFPDHGAGGGR